MASRVLHPQPSRTVLLPLDSVLVARALPGDKGAYRDKQQRGSRADLGQVREPLVPAVREYSWLSFGCVKRRASMADPTTDIAQGQRRCGITLSLLPYRPEGSAQSLGAALTLPLDSRGQWTLDAIGSEWTLATETGCGNWKPEAVG
ncbi:hypothetical protein BJ741DRAFT_654568 [Chytriomyces cf. hyalinus JEL632]|nr:hypothetical protein BJ741DRAFT_654568 [Chytriomyces cf. hyalinus JEL632]